MDDRLQTGKPSRYIANTKVNSGCHASGVVKLGLSGVFTCVWWQVRSDMAGDAP